MTIIDDVMAGLPEKSQVTEVAFEGSEIVLYTQNKDLFLSNGDFIKNLVSKLKKRIEIRPDPTIRKELETAQAVLEKMIPKEAGIDAITFEPGFGRVTIEALKPGLVIGKGGETLRMLKKESMWTPVVKRAPAIPSDVVKTIRRVLYNESEWRKKYLNDLGKAIYTSEKKPIDWIRMTALGAFREVGRSCVYIQTPGSKVILDCGIKPSSDTPYPYLQVPEFSIDKLDAMIISHAHLDHCGFAPYLYEYGYEGPMYCTPPTRDFMVLLCLDYIDIAEKEGFGAPYSTKAVEKAVKHSVVLEYGEVSDITPDMRVTLQNAGHIMGSAQTHLHIGDGLHNIVYTGDFNYEKTELFDPAFTGFQRVETLIMESTYGGADSIQPPRHEAEKVLAEAALRTVERGGKMIIPSFAVERAQDVMVILANSGLNAPVYLDGMLWDATAIHTTYPEYMGRVMQNKIFHKGENPFLAPIFKRVGSAKERREIIASDKPCVIIATSGMLVGGPALEYLRNFADSEKNTLAFVGYQAEGTLGKKIQNGWREIPLADPSGKRTLLPIKLEVVTVDGLSGHADRNQLLTYVHRLKDKPHKVICGHGEESRCLDLARTIHKMFKIETHVPKLLETIRLR